MQDLSWMAAASAGNAVGAATSGFGLSASLIIAIGAQNAYVLRQGLRREHIGLIVALCATLDLLLMGAGVLGLGTVLGEQPQLVHALTLGGAALLAAYGVAALWRAWPSPSGRAGGLVAGGLPLPHHRPGRLAVASRTLAISLLNPHVYLDTVVLVGTVGARQAPELRLAFLAGAGLASLAWFVALGLGARALAPRLASPHAWRGLDLLVGATMLTLALSLLRGAGATA